ncbi:MAG: hypothetical protein ACOVLE_00685 [Pirellula staleyi]
MIALIVAFVGCSTSAPQMGASTELKGNIKKAGKPIGDVLLTLQPMGDGHVVPLTVAVDGTFKGEVVPGKYAYYIGKSASKASEQAIKQVDAKYYEGNMSRTVMVESGKDLVITLD